MKLYRVHYGNDIRQGMYRGYSGTPMYSFTDIRDYMDFMEEFIDMSCKLHSPDRNEFSLPPKSDSLFYFKEEFMNENRYLINNFISSAYEFDITVNITTIDLDTITSYECIYQDENQMCLNIN